MFVVGSVFVHVPSSVVMVASPVMTPGMMASAVMTATMPTTVVAGSVASSMPATFGIRRRNDSNSERRSNRKHQRNLLQHFCFAPGR
jgi:hypothetical protein